MSRKNRQYQRKADPLRERIDFLVTADFKDRLTSKALEANMSLSEYVRSMVQAGMGTA